MPASIARRGFLAAPLLALPAFANDATSQLAELERRNGGRLGVAVLDRASGRRVGHRIDELFPLCSTFKFLAAAFVLARVDRGEEKLDRFIANPDEVVPGNSMKPYGGLSSSEDRKKIIAFLAQLR